MFQYKKLHKEYKKVSTAKYKPNVIDDIFYCLSLQISLHFRGSIYGSSNHEITRGQVLLINSCVESPVHGKSEKEKYNEHHYLVSSLCINILLW